MQKVLKTF